MLTQGEITKYICFALIIGLVLKFMPGLGLNDSKILQLVLASTVFLFLIDKFAYGNNIDSFENYEPMLTHEADDPELHDIVVSESQEEQAVYNNNLMVPKAYDFSHSQEDFAKTGLLYNHDKPGYFLINNGEFKEGGIPYDQACALIKKSKLNDFYNQHNHHIIWSPHTHLGKARGYLNWKEAQN